MSKFFSIDEAAGILGVTADTIREYVSDGKVEAIRRAGELVLRNQDVQKLLTAMPNPGLDASAVLGSLSDGAGHPERLSVTPRTSRDSGVFEAVIPSVGVGDSGSSEGALPSRKESPPAFLPVPSGRMAKRSARPTNYAGFGPIGGADIAESEDSGAGSIAPARSSDSMQAAPSVAKAAQSVSPPRLLGGSERRRMVRRADDGTNSAGTMASPSIEQIIEKAIDPIARAQARLIKHFSEVRDSLSEAQAGAGSASTANIEKAMSRLEARMEQLELAPRNTEIKALRSMAEVVLGSVRDEIRSLRACLEGKSEVGASSAEADSLRQECQTLREKIASLEAESGTEQPEVAELNAKLQALEQAKSESEGQVADLSAQVEALQLAGTELEEANKRLGVEIESLREGLKGGDEATWQLQAFVSQLEVLRQPLEAQDCEVKTFAEKIVAAFDESSRAYQQLESKYEACEEENSSLHMLIDRAQNESNSSKEQIQELLDKLQASALAQEEIAGETQRLNERISELEGEREVLNGRVAALQKSTAGSDEVVTQLQEELNKLQTENGVQQAQLEQAQAELERSNQELQALRQDSEQSVSFREQVEGELTAAQASLEEAKTEIERLTSELASVGEQTSEELAAYAELQNEHLQLQTACEQLQQEVVQMQEEAAKLQDAVTQMQEASTHNAEELAQQQQANGELQAQLTELNTSQTEVTAQLAAERSARSELSEQLTSERELYAALLQQHDKYRDSALSQQEELVQLQTVVTSTKAQVAELEAMVAESGEESTNLAGKLTEAQAQLELAVSERSELEVRLEDVGSEYEKVCSSLAEAQAESAQAKAQHDQLMVELEAAKAEQATLLAEKASAETQQAQAMKALRARYEEALSMLESEREKTASELLSRDTMVREAQEAMAKLESERNRSLKRQNTLQAKLEALRAEIEEAKDSGIDFDSMKAGQSRVEAELETVKQQLKEAMVKVSEAESAQQLLTSERDVAAKKALEYQEQIKALQYEVSMGGGSGVSSREMLDTIANFEAEAAEKDRLIQEAHRERADLRDELDNSQRALYELQQRHDKERREWSEVLARQIRGAEAAHNEAPAEGEQQRRGAGGWRLFKGRGGS